MWKIPSKHPSAYPNRVCVDWSSPPPLLLTKWSRVNTQKSMYVVWKCDKHRATGSKKVTKRLVRDIASSISEELSPGFSKEVLEEISTAAHVTTFADCVAFVKTLQRHRGEFNSLLQHMSESYTALFADVGKKATSDKYMELQLHWRQGLRKTCEYPNLHLPFWSFPS